MSNRLQVGVDFSQKRADFCLLFPDGRPLESRISFSNSCSGYSLAKQLLLDALMGTRSTASICPAKRLVTFGCPSFFNSHLILTWYLTIWTCFC